MLDSLRKRLTNFKNVKERTCDVTFRLTIVSATVEAGSTGWVPRSLIVHVGNNDTNVGQWSEDRFVFRDTIELRVTLKRREGEAVLQETNREFLLQEVRKGALERSRRTIAATEVDFTALAMDGSGERTLTLTSRTKDFAAGTLHVTFTCTPIDATMLAEDEGTTPSHAAHDPAALFSPSASPYKPKTRSPSLSGAPAAAAAAPAPLASTVPVPVPPSSEPRTRASVSIPGPPFGYISNAASGASRDGTPEVDLSAGQGARSGRRASHANVGDDEGFSTVTLAVAEHSSPRVARALEEVGSPDNRGSPALGTPSDGRPPSGRQSRSGSRVALSPLAYAAGNVPDISRQSDDQLQQLLNQLASPGPRPSVPPSSDPGPAVECRVDVRATSIDGSRSRAVSASSERVSAASAALEPASGAAEQSNGEGLDGNTASGSPRKLSISDASVIADEPPRQLSPDVEDIAALRTALAVESRARMEAETRASEADARAACALQRAQASEELAREETQRADSLVSLAREMDRRIAEGVAAVAEARQDAIAEGARAAGLAAALALAEAGRKEAEAREVAQRTAAEVAAKQASLESAAKLAAAVEAVEAGAVRAAAADSRVAEISKRVAELERSVSSERTKALAAQDAADRVTARAKDEHERTERRHAESLSQVRALEQRVAKTTEDLARVTAARDLVEAELRLLDERSKRELEESQREAANSVSVLRAMLNEAGAEKAKVELEKEEVLREYRAAKILWAQTEFEREKSSLQLGRLTGVVRRPTPLPNGTGRGHAGHAGRGRGRGHRRPRSIG